MLAPVLDDAADPVLAVLRVRSGIGGSIAYPIRSATTRIGRAPGNDVVLVAPSIAPQHAELTLREGLWGLRRLGEGHSWVDGEAMVESAWLAPGSDILLGEVRFAFDPRDRWADSPGEAESEPAEAPESVAAPAPERLLQFHEASSSFLIMPESEPDSRRVWLIAAGVTVAIVALTYFLLQAS
ncbi:MAG: FHA domain-containing protein [Gemmatimonadota bacterium]